MKLAVVDLGSNTVRLVIWEIYGQGFYRIVDELKETIRLGSDTDQNLIPQNKIDLMISTLIKFKKLSHSMRVDETIVVATESLRRAANGAEILQQTEAVTGLEIQLLDEYIEGYLAYSGVTGSMIIENSLMLDIGGASSELAAIEKNELIHSVSLPIGTLNMTEKFELSDIVTPKNHVQLEEYLHAAFAKIDWIKDHKFKTIILVGGSARTIGKIDRYRKRYPLTITHNYTLEDIDIISLFQMFMTKDAHARSKTQGLEADRADIILAALAIIKTITDITGTTELRISGKGLREGILYDYIKANYDIIPDMLDRSIYSILTRHDMNIRHAEHVANLTEKMFIGLEAAHRLDRTYLPVVHTAAMLHDIGMSIRYYDHEKHSFYIIINSDVNGLNHKEILLASYAAMFHRKVEHDLSMANFSHILNRLDVNNSEKIGILIALSESFERNVNGVIYDVKTEVTKDSIIIRPYSEEDIDLEIYEAYKLTKKFEELYSRKLIIEGIITASATAEAGDGS